jgi:AcrR family transcriptional regulator
MPTRRRVNPVPHTATPPARGRPRDADARDRVLRAARMLADANGPASVTIEAIAAQSGVSRPTIYRSWPNAQAVVMAALMPASATSSREAAARSALAALRQQLHGLAATFASRTGRSVTLMLATSTGETELSKAFRHHVILARRDEGRRLLSDAIARRELRADTDLEVALDALYGPIFFRILVGHAPVDEAFCDRLLDQLVSGMKAAPGRQTGSRVRAAR